MNLSIYNIFRAIAVFFTLVAVMFHPHLPQKRLLLFPNPDVTHVLFGAPLSDGQPSATWTDETEEFWRCDYQFKDNFYCGYSLYFPQVFDDFTASMDLTGYQGINMRLNYEGDAQRMRIFLRNYNPVYAKNGVWDSTKFISLNTLTSDLREEAYFSFDEFSVADWWILENDVSRKNAAPEFDRIITLGIDFVTPGTHKVRIEKVEFVGDLITSEQMYLSIILFWLAFIFAEGAHRLYVLRVGSSKSQKVISELESNYQRAEAEKKRYKAKSNTDPLTGILNRAGIDEALKKLSDPAYEKPSFALIIFDIDYFKQINDLNGHDSGDRVLQLIADLVSRNTRREDAFGRWGGEEFILICPNTTEAALRMFAEKLRLQIANYHFSLVHTKQVTVSLGATLANTDEPFQSVVKRADQSLYQAKHLGRNRVEFKL